MSVCFVVSPLVAVDFERWPVLAAAINRAGELLGYASARTSPDLTQPLALQSPGTRTVQVTMTDSAALGERMLRGESFWLERRGVAALFKLDGRGICTAHVSGVGKTDIELQEIGQELVNRVRQQFAYAKVMAELEERGFEVISQDVEANQSIRIRVRRWN